MDKDRRLDSFVSDLEAARAKAPKTCELLEHIQAVSVGDAPGQCAPRNRVRLELLSLHVGAMANAGHELRWDEDSAVRHYLSTLLNHRPSNVAIQRVEDGFLFACPHCGWHRAFRKVQNGATRLSEHVMARHHVKMVWPNFDAEVWQ